MALPNTDPSLPNSPAPIFQDNNFVTGPQLRLNNQAIWGDLQYLDDLIAALEISLEAEIAALDAEVATLDAQNVKITGNQTVAGIKTFSGRIQSNDGINLQNGEAVKLSEEFFIGHAVDGTPLFSKILTGTILNGAGFLFVAHGVPNALSSNRILLMQLHQDSGISESFATANSPSSSPWISSFDNTNLTLSRAVTSGDIATTIFIIYK